MNCLLAGAALGVLVLLVLTFRNPRPLTYAVRAFAVAIFGGAAVFGSILWLVANYMR